jgi:integrase
LDVFLYGRQVGEHEGTSMGESGLRDVGRLAVPATGAVVEAPGDRVLPVRLTGADGAEVAAVTEFLLDLRACGGSAGSARSYALALLRWFRFLEAVGVAWDRAGRTEARDFMLWLEAARKPERRRAPGSPAPGSVNPVTRKPYPGVQYAVRTRRHNRAVVRAFYEYHREAGTGPVLNPMPAGRGRDGGRADAHHNPLEKFERGRRADFQPQLPRQEPRYLPDAAFDALFAALGSDRDRAIVAFYISTGARASELLGVTCGRVDVGQQLVGVFRKGSGALQWLPASADAFNWLGLYRQGLGDRVTWGAPDPLWVTLRRPHRPLAYPAMRAVLIRANKVLGTNWTLHDLRHTAARRMIADPGLSLPDVQWLLGHALITTTQVYTEPSADEVVQRVRAHHAAQAEPRPPAAPAPGYRPEVLATLLGTSR